MQELHEDSTRGLEGERPRTHPHIGRTALYVDCNACAQTYVICAGSLRASSQLLRDSFIAFLQCPIMFKFKFKFKFKFNEV